jgi:hypothetical protein
MTGCFANPGDNIGWGIVGVIVGYAAWKILVHPSVIGGNLFLKVAYGLLIISALMLLA